MLMGLESSKPQAGSGKTDQPQRNEAKDSGLESAQRRRFLRSESEKIIDQDRQAG
ncbi:hypothetical protein SynA1825c_02014 [Synechococcus sp. A18-25c]|nr:hypothetical protein SynA1825c_02014 [Synechococcus sp. A18-25c]